jgi:two-component system, response regulator PdtaR
MANDWFGRVVLVVEDEPLVRLDIVMTFEDAGFKVHEADSAEEAIDVLEHEPEIRAVFTDIELRGTMDGLELAHYVRRRWPPTILVVGSGRIHPSAAAMPSSAVFIPKPYGEGTVAEVARGILSKIADARQ